MQPTAAVEHLSNFIQMSGDTVKGLKENKLSPVISGDVFANATTVRSVGREQTPAVKVAAELKVGDAYQFDLAWFKENMEGVKVEGEGGAIAKVVGRINSFSNKTGKPSGWRLRTKRAVDPQTQKGTGLMIMKFPITSDNGASEDAGEEE